MVIYILTKFGADWLIFVDATVLTRKLWTDGRTSDGRMDGHRRTVSDHNSSLSTPCSGELKKSKLHSKHDFNLTYLTRTKNTKPTIRLTIIIIHVLSCIITKTSSATLRLVVPDNYAKSLNFSHEYFYQTTKKK